MMNAAIFMIFKMAIELLFFVGCFRALLFLKKKDFPLPQRFLPTVLAGLFILPFLFYAIIGVFIPKFGHARNFFYLLPLYFLLAFYGLEAVLRLRWVFNAGVLVLIVFLTTAGFSTVCPIWKNTYGGRAMLQLASELNVDAVFVPYTFSHTAWVFIYYTKSLHSSSRIFPRSQHNMLNFFGATEKLHPSRKIAVIEEGLRDRGGADGGKYNLGGKSLNIKSVKTYDLIAGPGGFARFFISPFASITVYFFQDE